MNLLVTENKSTGSLNPVSSTVRVFVNNDYSYGYFVDEHELFKLFTPEQQTLYLSKPDVKLDVAAEVIDKIIEIGESPYKK